MPICHEKRNGETQTIIGLSDDVVSITFSPGAGPGAFGVVFVESERLPRNVDGMSADDLISAGGSHAVIAVRSLSNIDALIDCLVSLRQQMQTLPLAGPVAGAEAKA